MFRSSYKIEGNDIMKFNGNAWMKVFYHDATGKDYFLDENEAISLISEKKYNKLSYLSEAFKVRGKFEFIIYWPLMKQYFRWRQEKNPLFEYEQENVFTASGFEPLRNASGSAWCKWGGLVRTTKKNSMYINSLIKGCPGQKEWHFAIGMYNATDGWHDSGIPSHQSGTNLVELWVRLPNYLRFCTHLHERKKSISFLFVCIFVLCSS